MNQKAQASLEYLMTYGWALIMISTVIGILVFLVGTPTQMGIDCQSSDPTQIDFVGARFDAATQPSPSLKYWLNGKIVLRNIAAGRIKIISLQKDAYFSSVPVINGIACNAIGPLNTVEIASGETFTIEENTVMYDPDSEDFSCDPNMVPYDRDFGNFYITYLDKSGLSHNLILSCRNFPLD